MEHPATWAAIGTAIVTGVALLTFWLNFADRITKARDLAIKSVEALRSELDDKIDHLRQEREKAGSDLNVQIMALHQTFSLYREQSAKDQREFVTREMLRDFEQRIERAMKESADRVFGAIDGLSKRIDHAIGDRASR